MVERAAVSPPLALRGALLACATAGLLALPAVARAHIEIRPPFVEDGVATPIALAIPNERAPHATVAVRVAVPVGITIDAAPAPEGWSVRADGRTVTWRGGRLTGASTTRFGLTVTTRVRAGTVTLTAVQTYDDGARVRWAPTLSVLPASGTAAPSQHPWGALVAGLVGLGVVALSVIGLGRLRRRR